MQREQIKGLINYVVMEYRRTMHMDSDKQMEALTDEVIRRELIPSDVKGVSPQRLMEVVHILDEAATMFRRMEHHMPTLAEDEVFVAFVGKWAQSIESLTAIAKENADVSK